MRLVVYPPDDDLLHATDDGRAAGAARRAGRASTEPRRSGQDAWPLDGLTASRGPRQLDRGLDLDRGLQRLARGSAGTDQRPGRRRAGRGKPPGGLLLRAGDGPRRHDGGRSVFSLARPRDPRPPLRRLLFPARQGSRALADRADRGHRARRLARVPRARRRRGGGADGRGGRVVAGRGTSRGSTSSCGRRWLT